MKIENLVERFNAYLEDCQNRDSAIDALVEDEGQRRKLNFSKGGVRIRLEERIRSALFEASSFKPHPVDWGKGMDDPFDAISLCAPPISQFEMVAGSGARHTSEGQEMMVVRNGRIVQGPRNARKKLV